jgi:protein-S-isoprenylcysteine O-methyltransferase Ste14
VARGWLALGVECLFLLVVTTIRLRLQRRWEGTAFVSGRPGLAHPWEWLYWLAVAGFGVGTMLALAVADPWPALRAGAWVAGALVAIALGTALVARAQLVMGASWRIGVDFDAETALVTGGPFRRVRNPIYVGMVAVAAGLAVILANAAAFVGLVSLAVWVELQVRTIEEPFLRDRHGAAYVRWAARTGRFLPRLGRAQDGRSGRSG